MRSTKSFIDTIPNLKNFFGEKIEKSPTRWKFRTNWSILKTEKRYGELLSDIVLAKTSI